MEGETMNTVNDTLNATSNSTANAGAQQTGAGLPAWMLTDEASGGQAAVPARRMLYRHPSDKLIGGVCGGLAEYLNWNPVIVRVLWVVATFATWGGGILAYLLLAMFLPTGTNAVGQLRPPAVEMNQKGVTWAAGLLIGFGGLWLLLNLGILPGMWRFFWGLVGVIFWPALLIGAGYLLLRANRQSDLNQDLVESARKMKDSVSEKLPSSDQVKTGFANLQQSMPLRRSRTNRMFMGVCGGMAERFGIDANLIRLIWAAFAIGTMGLGALLYGLVGILLPEAGAMQTATSGSANGAGPEKVQNISIANE
jgi:phage shock protein PspC (stress-responsive transcriptional regulator)